MPKKIDYQVQQRGPLSDFTATLNKTIVEWDWQSQIRPLIDQVIELKKIESKVITGNDNYDSYAGLCGYLQALVTILGSKSPSDVVQWLENEKIKLEADMPFLILKYAGNK